MTNKPSRPIPSEKPMKSDDIACSSCGALDTLTIAATMIGCRLCGVLWGRCNGRWAEGQPPRPGIVEAMKRPIPSDAHLCVDCKIRQRYMPPRFGARELQCNTCYVNEIVRDADERKDAIREFHGPWQGGNGDDAC